MSKLVHRFFIALVTLHVVAGENRNKYEIKNDKKLKATLNNLLHTVTSVNEERLDALKKFYELQNYLPKVGRTNENIVALIIPNDKRYITDSREEFYENGPNIEPGGTPAILKLIKNPNTQNSVHMRSFKSDDTEEKFSFGNSSSFLRQWKGCNKSASKYCKKACTKAFREVCDDYKCSKSMKKSSKRVCKRICNSEFGNDDH